MLPPIVPATKGELSRGRKSPSQNIYAITTNFPSMPHSPMEFGALPAVMLLRSIIRSVLSGRRQVCQQSQGLLGIFVTWVELKRGS